MKRLAVTIPLAVVVGLASASVRIVAQAQAPASAAKAPAKSAAKAVDGAEDAVGRSGHLRAPGRPTTCAAFRRSGRTSSPAGRS